jgi:hypothetical protein
VINRSNKSSAETLLHTHKNNSSKSIKQYLREFLRSKPLKINKKNEKYDKKRSISSQHRAITEIFQQARLQKKRKKEEKLFLLAFAISI